MMHNENNLVGLHIILQLGYPICLYVKICIKNYTSFVEIYAGVCMAAITKQSFLGT